MAVALLMVAELLSTPLKIMEQVYPDVGKPVPVTETVEASVTEIAEIVGEPTVNYSNSHLVASLLAQALPPSAAVVLSLRALLFRISVGLVMQVNVP